jgi:hypothetical protein
MGKLGKGKAGMDWERGMGGWKGSMGNEKEPIMDVYCVGNAGRGWSVRDGWKVGFEVGWGSYSLSGSLCWTILR